MQQLARTILVTYFLASWGTLTYRFVPRKRVVPPYRRRRCSSGKTQNVLQFDLPALVISKDHYAKPMADETSS